MSETGATPEQIEAAARRAWEAENGRDDRVAVVVWEDVLPSLKEVYRNSMSSDAQYLVPPGYRIVGPDAVVLTAEEAALCREACELAACEADGESTGFASIAFIDAANEQTQRAVVFRALAAKLGGAA